MLEDSSFFLNVIYKKIIFLIIATLQLWSLKLQQQDDVAGFCPRALQHQLDVAALRTRVCNINLMLQFEGH